ncbi:GT2 family glycosyltransferase [Spinactinospora alkalitolerans]|uniref:GT2 family glycosyltransferase n=1 Tax=Spinactinospora alkalitolerans TaxID=687207 RepID=A0A852TZN8_9ACTN|nr:glycosyltransferase [Spinactinospora alkalitolerans]NYE47240.1 GT2 family glycosyltransferase [Spinactinospora alkalitolerans]
MLNEDTPVPRSSRVTVVVATKDRREELGRTLSRLAELRPRPPVIVVDNASADGTGAFTRSAFPWVEAVTLPENRGAAARNVGVALARTPYVAFSDDDSWWAPGALERAADVFDECPRLGLLAAAAFVGEERRPDPINAQMAQNPFRRGPGLPGPEVLGFLACAAVVRRTAFEQVGGFSELLFFTREEALLAQDLAAAGWALCHVADVHALHHPSALRPPGSWRGRLERRNAVLAAWLRRPLERAVRETGELARAAVTDPGARGALGEALRRMPRALRGRRRLPARVERDLRILETR